MTPTITHKRVTTTTHKIRQKTPMDRHAEIERDQKYKRDHEDETDETPRMKQRGNHDISGDKKEGLLEEDDEMEDNTAHTETPAAAQPTYAIVVATGRAVIPKIQWARAPATHEHCHCVNAMVRNPGIRARHRHLAPQHAYATLYIPRDR